MTDGPSRSADREVRCVHCGDKHPASYSHCPRTGKTLTTGKALIGRVFADRYRIVGLLGEGGMGTVYVAEHLLIGRKVALKRLHPELASDAKAVARFQREARAAASTGHENIVEILDLGYGEDDAPYLVMEYLKGQSLATTLRKEGHLAPARACHIVGQLLAALHAVHRQQIVHRDLKPDNIFLTRRSGRGDYVKVLDFGVSKMRREDGERLDLTRTGVLLGTPFYMSPEQARGMKNLDHRVDLYASGVILYEALSGRLPFEGANYHALLQTILAHNPIPLSQLVPTLPGGLSDFVHRAIARDPGERFANAQEMLQALVPFGAVESPSDDADFSFGTMNDAEEGPASVEFEPPTIMNQPAKAVDVEVAKESDERDARTSTSPPPPDTSRGIYRTEPDRAAEPIARAPKPRTHHGQTPPRPYVAQSSDWVEGGAARSPTNPAWTPTPTPMAREPRARYDAILRDALGGSRSGTGTNRNLQSSLDLLAQSTSDTMMQTGEHGYPAVPITERRRGFEVPDRSVEPHVKGSLILAATEHIQQGHGQAALDRVFEALSPDVRTTVTGVLLPVAWFPLGFYENLLSAAEKVLGTGDGNTAPAIGSAVASRELPTTHRLFMQAATPVMAVDRIPQLWRTYYNRGQATVKPLPGGRWRIEVVDLEQESLLHAMAMAGFYRRLIELAGGRDVHATVISARGRGDEKTVTSVRWR